MKSITYCNGHNSYSMALCFVKKFLLRTLASSFLDSHLCDYSVLGCLAALFAGNFA
jgi:hypothetical protein